MLDPRLDNHEAAGKHLEILGHADAFYFVCADLASLIVASDKQCLKVVQTEAFDAIFLMHYAVLALVEALDQIGELRNEKDGVFVLDVSAQVVRRNVQEADALRQKVTDLQMEVERKLFRRGPDMSLLLRRRLPLFGL